MAGRSEGVDVTAPRRIPWNAHALEAILLALLIALFLDVLDLPFAARLTLGLVVFIAFCAFGISVQVRCWGSFIVPALTRARVSLAVFIGVMAVVVGAMEHGAPVLLRAAAAILLPLTFFVLSRWDDARTVEVLRAPRPEQRGHLPDVPPPS